MKFILTLGPGSGADIGARLLADRLTKKWNQPIVIENRPGGDGTIVINAFVGAQDDHVLLFAPSSSFIGHPYEHDHLPYKPSDLAPIARVYNTVIGISVPVDLPVKTLRNVVELARAKPGQLNWAGLTGALDIMFEGWLKSIGVDIKKVPYRNPVEAVNDLATGRVQVYESAYAIARPQIQAGKIKLLAITNTMPASAIPDTPTVAEAGYPALTMDGLVGLFARYRYEIVDRPRSCGVRAARVILAPRFVWGHFSLSVLGNENGAPAPSGPPSRSADPLS